MTELLIPGKLNAQQLNAATIALLVGFFYGSGVKVSLDDVTSTVLVEDSGARSEEMRSIIGRLAREAVDFDAILKFNDETLKPLVNKSQKLNASAAQKITEMISRDEFSVNNLILFAALHSMVFTRGKMAIAVDAPLMMWYQKVFSSPKVKQALAPLARAEIEKHTRTVASPTASLQGQKPYEQANAIASEVKAKLSKKIEDNRVAAEAILAEHAGAQRAETAVSPKLSDCKPPFADGERVEAMPEDVSAKSADQGSGAALENMKVAQEAQINTENTISLTQSAAIKPEAPAHVSAQVPAKGETGLPTTGGHAANAKTLNDISVDESIALLQPVHPILPKDNQRNILITSALPYVNNVPHLGNIIGSVLSADFYSRYVRARGLNSIFICGTDEYGTATETKAIEEKLSPYELCTKYHHIHKEVYDWFQIGFDHFGRTSTPEQTEVAQEIFMKLYKNEYLEEHSMTQLYCETHKGFLADRYVEGTCPKCGFKDARGDQCDGCGTLLDPLELIEPRCKLDNSTPVMRETKHIYLSLDKLQVEVEKWLEESHAKDRWSRNGLVITSTWLRDGLKPRAITRDLKWGTPVPLEEYKDKVLYVWFDATIGYPSITATYTPEWRQWWCNPEKVDLYQFMGKDNVPFHTVIFPASQIGTREKWTKLHTLSTTEYLQYEGGKFSKSRNTGVFGNNVKDTGIDANVWRYYLACLRPETADAQFSWNDFVMRNNNELLANLGNFANRVIKFTISKYESVLPEFEVGMLPRAEALVETVNSLIKQYIAAMDTVQLREGLEIAMKISGRGNQFLQECNLNNTLFAESPVECAAVVGVALNLIYVLSSLIYPFMPGSAERLVEQLNAPLRMIPDAMDFAIKPGHKIGKAAYLFTRINPEMIEVWQGKYGGKTQAEATKKESKRAKKKAAKANKKAVKPEEKVPAAEDP